MREFLARIIEGDSRRGARVDLGIDLRPKALSLDGSPPSSLSHVARGCSAASGAAADTAEPAAGGSVEPIICLA